MVYNVFTIRWVPVGHILQYCGHIAMACSASSHILINDDNLAQSTDESSTQPEAWMRKWVLFRNGFSSEIHVLLYANHKTSIFNLNCNVFFLLPGVSLNLTWNHWKQTQYNRWGTFVFFAAIRPKVSFSYWIAFKCRWIVDQWRCMSTYLANSKQISLWFTYPIFKYIGHGYTGL